MFRAPGAAPATFAAPSSTATAVQPPLPAPFSRPGARRGASAPAPTAEQAAIVDAYLTGQHLTVEALAGTGKTTSLRLVAESRPGRSGLYLAYNKAIADEAQGRFPARVACGTAHAFAYRAVGQRYAHRLPSRFGTASSSRRMPAWEVARTLRLRDERIGERHFTDAALARLAEATVTRFCQSADPDIGDGHVPAVAGVEKPCRTCLGSGAAAIDATSSGVTVTSCADCDGLGRRSAQSDLAAVVVPAARRMWTDLCDPAGNLYFQHDHYLKMWQLSGPVLPTEYVLFDEAQDANPVIAAIVAAQDHAQLIYVGDRNQAIYGWRGAVDAMSTFDAGIRLPLTRSFRFGPRIADEANRWLNMLDSPLQVTGHEPITSTVGYVEQPKAVLCRSNGGAIGAVMHAQEQGRKVALVGDGVEVRRFAFAARSLMAGKGCDLPELAAFKTWAALVEYVDQEESGRDLAVLVKLVQRYSPGTLIDTVNALVPVKRAELVVSTAHKAKGLEWPAVRIGDDFNPPVDGDQPERAELMLAYVAVTRAQHQLDRGSLDWPLRGRLAGGRWMSYDADDDPIRED